MNDRFKFRVWNKLTHSFTTGGAIKFGGLCFIDEEDLGIKLGEHQELYVIEQCTGLKDKNGNLIYESDYVKDKDGDIYLVKWDAELVQFNATGKDDCGFEILTPFMKGETETLEICGNIHEQAEQKGVK